MEVKKVLGRSNCLIVFTTISAFLESPNFGEGFDEEPKKLYMKNEVLYYQKVKEITSTRMA